MSDFGIFVVHYQLCNSSCIENIIYFPTMIKILKLWKQKSFPEGVMKDVSRVMK
jgi:hypothetical protein